MDMVKDARSKADFHRAGAIVTFVGVVRGLNSKGEQIQKLELEAYEEKANQTLASICDNLKKKPGIVDVQIHHLLGEFNVGEDIVYVFVAGSHRLEVFSVLEEAVERYKKEAPIFKKEHVRTGEGKLEASWVAEDQDTSKV
jgi:molybdopterin synthase catalytic subunit